MRDLDEQIPLRRHRQKRNGHAGHVIWLTGLSGAGKSTIARGCELLLVSEGCQCYVLDGDVVRGRLNRDLGFDPADRTENLRRIAEVAAMMAEAGLIVIAATISPTVAGRRQARAIIGAEIFSEVFVSTPLGVCESRDPKGLYRKARAGQLQNFTGIDAPYEPPSQADLVLDTAGLSIEDSVKTLANFVIRSTRPSP